MQTLLINAELFQLLDTSFCAFLQMPSKLNTQVEIADNQSVICPLVCSILPFDIQ